jgi:transposase
MTRIHLLDPGHRTPRNWKVQKDHAELMAWLATQEGVNAEFARDEMADIIRTSAEILVLRRRIEASVRPVAPQLLALQGCAELTGLAPIPPSTASLANSTSEPGIAVIVGNGERVPKASSRCDTLSSRERNTHERVALAHARDPCS